MSDRTPGADDRVRLVRAWVGPLVLVQAYLSATVALFFLGPWPWPVERPYELLAYLVAAQGALALGFLCAWRAPVPGQPVLWPAPPSGRALAIAATVAVLALAVPTSIARTGAPVPDVIRGFAEAGIVYNELQARMEEAGRAFVVVEYSRILFAPLLAGLLPWAIVFGGRLAWPWRAAAVLGLAMHAATYVATGTNKGLADMLITVPWLVLLALWRREYRLAIPRWAIVVALVVAAAVFLDFFGRGQAQREGGVGEFGLFNTGAQILEADREHPVSRTLPPSGVIVLESLARYLGQGYFALEQSFELDAGRTLGAGNSMFLARNADGLLGTSRFTDESLPGQLERARGWGAFALWHSIYPWLASDVGFAGTLVLMAGVGWLFGAVLLDALRTLRPSSVSLLGMLVMLVHYIPANNQLMQSGESTFAFLATLAWWAVSRAVLPDGAGSAGRAGGASAAPGGARQGSAVTGCPTVG